MTSIKFHILLDVYGELNEKECIMPTQFDRVDVSDLTSDMIIHQTIFCQMIA